MKQAKESTSCSRCRLLKRRCDKIKPSCARCKRGGIPCAYEADSEMDKIGPMVSNDSNIPYQTPAGTRTIAIRKRNRVCLSCTRCHRLKVKCDQKQPCLRCSRSGVEADCVYTHKSKPRVQPHEPAIGQSHFQEIPQAGIDEDPEFLVATWFLRRRESTRFRGIVNLMESLASVDSTPFGIAVKQHIESHCSSDFALPSNYPFGSPGSGRYASPQQVHELIHKARDDVAALVAGYFKSFHPALPVFDQSGFDAKLTDFWREPESADLIWLAQFLAVLGLGAFTFEYAMDNGKPAASEFLYASEACMARTTYMAHPTTTAISTLCLMVIAKQATTATCWALDTCWNVMGLIVRLSMMMVLHKEWMPGYKDPIAARERAVRRRLWTMVVYLDTQMSTRTGQQSVLPHGIINSNTFSVDKGDCWDTIIPRSLPLVCDILSHMNVHDGEIFSYNKVLKYDREITQLMHEATAFYEGDIVELTLDIYFRRALLVVHCQYALQSNALSVYPESYNATIEINLALLSHYHRLSSISPHTHLLAEPYMMDFLSAAITTCMMLLGEDAVSSSSTMSRNVSLTHRKPMLDSLMRCMDILANNSRKVFCFTTGFKQIQAIYALTLKDNPVQYGTNSI
ncbi:hypothetical protein C7974DRAFT_122248 [Boeremia exigua]|uniref:uncharacterized protein n=1 Tax=Boeremia exigua TaxID=749465 RepID=UPI001E8DC1E3|nr:uncharacterized protein C7974DRAFT_122248 [Boeremia exigua]KAH6638835.1 hypothetical protein C7974DRAFT_122248 [Boeremia exigua]